MIKSDSSGPTGLLENRDSDLIHTVANPTLRFDPHGPKPHKHGIKMFEIPSICGSHANMCLCDV